MASMDSSEQHPASAPGDAAPPPGGRDYPLTFSVDYPDRWHNRVAAYAFLLITDRYPPFSLQA